MARKVLDDNGVLYFWSKIKSFFVAKEDGKGLSTNDYTTAEKNKLAGIASGAEVNQNAFSTVRVGTTGEFSFSASAKKDIITLSQGVGVTLTLDADRKIITFSSHTHANKDTLDNITADVYAEIMGAKNQAHTHSNKGTLDKITDVVWNQVFGQSHTHANADILDDTTASFTTALLTKLNGIADGANKTTVDSKLSSTSTNPVQNKAVNTALAGKLNTAARGAKNGVASLDANGLIPSSQLPSFVDDVIEGYYSDGKFYKEATHKTEITGATGKIYVDLSTNLSYRYGGSAYVQITSSDMVAITNTEIDAICV